MKRKVVLLAIVSLSISLFVFPTAATSGDSDRIKLDRLDRLRSTVYKMHRPGLRVRLEVRGNKIIVPIQIWALRKCSNGFEGSSGLSLEEPGQGISIQDDKHFEYKSFIGEGFWWRTRLGGRVRKNTISGFYQEWAREGPSGPICGTGRPGDRTLRFVARADRS